MTKWLQDFWVRYSKLFNITQEAYQKQTNKTLEIIPESSLQLRSLQTACTSVRFFLTPSARTVVKKKVGARGEPQSGGEAGSVCRTTWGDSPARLPPALTPTPPRHLVLRHPMLSLPSWLCGQQTPGRMTVWTRQFDASPSIPDSGMNNGSQFWSDS